MTERTDWEIEKLKENEKEIKNDIVAIGIRVTSEVKEVNKNFTNEIKSLDKRLIDLENFKISTVEKMTTIFNRIDSLKEDDLWLKRTFGATLITGVISAVISFIVWAIQN